MKATVIEYEKLYYEEDCPVGITGLSTFHATHPIFGQANPPVYLKGDISELKIVKETFCCPDMENAYRIGTVGFGERKNETYRNKVAEVFIHIEGGSKNDIAIPFCLWCKAPVFTQENMNYVEYSKR